MKQLSTRLIHHKEENMFVNCTVNIATTTSAILLADSRIELFSTDMPPMSRVQLIGPDYTTRSCRCKIRNIACLGCGNEIGYHITRPCLECLKACNNGHFWMFLMESVNAYEQKDTAGNSVLFLANLPNETDMDLDFDDCVNQKIGNVVCR
ncbi:hypothetical protein BB558_004501 [Smittium angustum]|uniref:Protein FAM72 n=1 Tax=Smittium angustum TaxID=133377 RepID=A0A2U1J2Z2_SMIAN|nr:hypothetical protein BB558_004501 [Smittium angustum]